MNLETLLISGKKLTNKKKDNEYKVGFFNIPQSELESFEKAYAYVLNSFDMDMSVARGRVDRYLESLNYPKVQQLTPAEQEKRLQIRNTALKGFLKSEFDYVRFHGHHTKDPTGCRYTKHHFMQHTPDKDADLAKNQRLSYLLDMANQHKYDDNKELDEISKNEKAEFVQYYRDRVNSIENYNLEALISKEWTDEELAEHAHEIYSLASLFTDFNDFPRDLNRFGIKDPDCEKVINTYDHYGEYFMMLETRLATITSLSYHLYDSEKEPNMFYEIDDGELQSDNKYTDCMDSYISYKNTVANSERKTIQRIFKELGVAEDKLYIFDPKIADGKNDPSNAIQVMNKKGEVTFFSEDPKYSITFNIKSGELSKALAQNKLSELIEQGIVTDPEFAPKPVEVARPPEVSFFGKVADLFTSIFTHHKPRQEAYNRSMTEYNDYLAAQDRYDKYVKGHDDFLAKGHEKADRLSLAAALRKREQAIKDNMRQAKLAKQIKNQEIGIVNIPDNNNIVINNNEAAKNLIEKELADNNHPINEKKAPENNDIKKIRIQRAKKIADRANKQNALYKKYINDGITTKYKLSPFDRVAMLWLDTSGTPEAERNNINLLKKLETPEGQAEYLKKGLNSLINLNVKQLVSKDLDELLDVAEKHWNALSFAFDPSFLNSADPQVQNLYKSCAGVLQEGGMIKNIITGLTTEEYEQGTFDGMSSQEIQNYTRERSEIYNKSPYQPPNGPKVRSKMALVQGLVCLADRNERYAEIEQKLRDSGFTGTTVKDLANTKFTDSEGVEQTPSKVLDGILTGKSYNGESRTPAEKEKLDTLLEFPAKDKSIYNNAQLQM